MRTRYLPRAPAILAVALALSVAGPSVAQTTIGSPGGSTVHTWGKPNTQTYGQTVTTPLDNFLNSFTFWLGPAYSSSVANLSFRAYVYEWSAGLARAIGSALYTSEVRTRNVDQQAGYDPYIFNTGGLALTPGNMYVLFLSMSGLAGSGGISWASNVSNAYTGGSFVYQNNGENTSMWTNSGWNVGFVTADDLRFEAQFGPGNVVPEPSTWILLVTGLLALGIASRRRRKEDREGLELPA